MHKPLILLLVTLLLSPVNSNAKITEAGGNYSGNIVWEDTIIIRDTVYIEENAFLKIKPGTVVLFDTTDISSTYYYKSMQIISSGYIEAIGTPDSIITFTSLYGKINNMYFSIYIRGKGRINFKFCKIIYGYDFLTIEPESQQNLISNCTFYNVSNFTITKGSNAEISNCLFEKCHTSIGAYNSNIHHNIFWKSTNDAVRDFFGSNNLFYNNIYWNSPYSWAALLIHKNAKALIFNNVIGKTKYGIRSGGEQVDLENTIIKYNLFFQCEKNFAKGGSDISSAQDWENPPSEGIITADPMFMDPDNGDFHLKPGSPCINAGDPNPQYNDPDGSRGDIGVFPFGSTSVFNTKKQNLILDNNIIFDFNNFNVGAENIPVSLFLPNGRRISNTYSNKYGYVNFSTNLPDGLYFIVIPFNNHNNIYKVLKLTK